MKIILTALLIVAMATCVHAADDDDVVAIQLCAITAPEKLTHLRVVSEGEVNGVHGETFSTEGRTPLTDEWRATSVTGQLVAVYWAQIDATTKPTFIIVNNQVLPIKAAYVPADRWTEWEAPTNKVADGSLFAYLQANNEKPALESEVGEDAGFRLRLKRMKWSSWLANAHPHGRLNGAWTGEPIPACH